MRCNQNGKMGQIQEDVLWFAEKFENSPVDTGSY